MRALILLLFICGVANAMDESNFALLKEDKVKKPRPKVIKDKEGGPDWILDEKSGYYYQYFTKTKSKPKQTYRYVPAPSMSFAPAPQFVQPPVQQFAQPIQQQFTQPMPMQQSFGSFGAVPRGGGGGSCGPGG